MVEDPSGLNSWELRNLWWTLVVALIASASSVDERLGRRASRGIVAVALAGIVLLLSGCGDNGVISRFMLKSDRIIVERRPDPVYDQLFPYYVELCATSQFRSKLKGEGGVAGHAVMYIKGACKDEQAPFPQLRRCRVRSDSAGRSRARCGGEREPLVP